MYKLRGLAIALTAALVTVNSYAADETVTLRGATLIGGPVDPVIVSIDPATLAKPRDWQPGDPIKEMPLAIPKNWVPPTPDARPIDGDPLMDQQNLFGGQSGGVSFDTPLVNVDGSGFTGVNPSDTVGDVGINHYIQLINNGNSSRVLILNKNDGTEAQNFVLDALAAGSGTGCGGGNGDPIINFDESVDNGPTEDPGRWVLTEFTGNSLCFYISQTADPTTGNWFIYEFGSVSGGLPDYPKYAVWPDAYYVGSNENQPNTRTYAFDRANMLLGNAAEPAQSFLAPGLPGFGFQHLMPVDWDGDLAPPPGTPGLFMRHRDDEVHDAGSSNPTQDLVELWEFDVDWTTPANSTLTGPINVATAEFDSNFCNLIFSGCLAQPNSGTTLFALLQPIMWRAQYRNFGSHQALVASFSTDVSTDISGVRWVELRNVGAGWTNFQEGTVATADGVSRWMSSAAMDESGNIVAGYNIVGDVTPPVFPGMRYSGRLIGDPLGTMPRGEVSIIEGNAPNGSIRYGDYTALTVDPVDGCTFWYTAQYNQTTQWSTRVASFKFDACGEPGFAISSNNRQASVCTIGGAAPYQFNLDIFQVNGFNNPVTLSLNPAPPAGISGSFSPNPVAPPGASTLSGNVGGGVAPGNYLLTAEGVATGATNRTLDLALDVFTANPGAATPTLPVNNAGLVGFQPTLEWTAGAQVQTFILELDDDPAFASIDYTTTITDGSTSHVVGLVLNTETRYFWRIRSQNECGEEAGGTVFSFTTMPPPGDCPAGAPINFAFEDDIEGGINGWTSQGIEDTWVQSTARAFSGTTSWNAEDLPIISDQQLISPPIDLPSGELPMSLVYWNWQTIEDDTGAACWDGAILEISTDAGANWTQLDSELLTDPYDGVVNNFAAGPNPLAGLNAWCADPEDWTRSVVDLSAFQGETVQFRFRLGSDSTVGREGWYIDDVSIQSCLSSDDILLDSFEDLVTPP